MSTFYQRQTNYPYPHSNFRIRLMGTYFIKVIFGVNVYRKRLFVPKGRDKLCLNIFRLTEVFKQSHFSNEDYAGSQIYEISQAFKELKTINIVQ